MEGWRDFDRLSRDEFYFQYSIFDPQSMSQHSGPQFFPPVVSKYFMLST